jgi:CHAT domain-containing protein/tetratricopeptide (TPR) repeat protein
VNNNLANKLLKAKSAATFLRAQRGAIDWQVLSALKSEVDRLRGRDLNAAENLSIRISELANLLNNPVSQAFADASRAYVLHQQGNHRAANDLYENAVTVMRRANLATEAAIIQKTQVDALKYLGRFNDALQTARSARRSLAAAGDVQIAQLETNIGNVYYQLDNYKKALAYYDRAHAIFSANGEEGMQAMVDFGRANIFTELDQPEQALALLEGAVAIFKKSGQDLKAAQTLFHIAYIQFLRGNYNIALKDYYQARETLTALGSSQLAAWCDLEIAEILLALNAFEDAHESAIRAQQHFAELGMNYESAKASMTCALAAAGLQNLDEAQSLLLSAHQVFAKDNNKTFAALADMYIAELAIQRKDYSQALQRAESAGRLFARHKLPTRSAYSRWLAAKAAYLSGNSTKTERLIKNLLKEMETSFAPAIIYKSHHLLGQVQRQRKRPALEHFRNAVAVIENMRSGIAADEFKTTFLRDKIEIYEDAIQACLNEDNEAFIEEAFHLVESSKSRALADLITRYVNQSDTRTERGINTESRKQLAKLIQDLNWYSSHAGLEEDKGDQRKADVAERYRREVQRCEKQIARLFRRLEVESSAFAEIQSTNSTNLNDLRQTLTAGECAIEYFITGDEISAFVATPERIKIARNIASKAEVEKAVTGFRFQIEKFNYGQAYVNAYFGQLKRTTDGYLAKLYQLIFAPLEQFLSSEKIIIIPHGLLHYTPFHALRSGEKYLIDLYEISYAPSASVLKLCRNRHQKLNDKSIVKTANSIQQAGILPNKVANSLNKETEFASRSINKKSLKSDISMLALGVAEQGTPSIEDEISTLGSIFPDCLRLTGDQATHENLKRFAPQARFLHLASHGFFRRDNPMFSFLKLVDANLHFYNLLDLELKAELVTLSACHTGVNAIFPGDELQGLMRGFLYAGTPSMVVSLWAVNDRSTTELMREMYGNLKAGESKSKALRKAQLAIKEAYGHPYYWAPFILMGDTGSANI